MGPPQNIFLATPLARYAQISWGEVVRAVGQPAINHGTTAAFNGEPSGNDWRRPDPRVIVPFWPIHASVLHRYQNAPSQWCASTDFLQLSYFWGSQFMYGGCYIESRHKENAKNIPSHRHSVDSSATFSVTGRNRRYIASCTGLK